MAGKEIGVATAAGRKLTTFGHLSPQAGARLEQLGKGHGRNAAWPLPIDLRRAEVPDLEPLMACIDFHAPLPTDDMHGNERVVAQQAMIDLTSREKQVLAALELGLPNKLIAAKLNLSKNTVKMHIQHIMRKCRARNRTETVLLWNELSGKNGRARLPLS